MNEIEYAMALHIFLIGVLLVVTAAVAPPITGPAAQVLGLLYADGALATYGVLHVTAAWLHMYSLRYNRWRQTVLTLELALVLLLTFLLVLVGGFLSPTWVYFSFMATVIMLTRRRGRVQWKLLALLQRYDNISK